MTWIAEDVPWYSVDRSTARVMTDEDYAMSAPEVLGRFDSRQGAEEEVAARLETMSELRIVARREEQELYLSAARAMLMGVDGIRIAGRFYRVREV